MQQTRASAPILPPSPRPRGSRLRTDWRYARPWNSRGRPGANGAAVEPEAGASGHPLMTVEAIASAAANFRSCLERLWPEAAKRGVSRGSFERHTAALEPDLRIMDLLDSQPEFNKTVWDYLDILVSDARIATGREMLARYQSVFDQVEKAYGVERTIIAAIWGVETNYGTLGGDRPVIRSTATLACIGRRQEFFRKNSCAALEILHRGDVKPENLRGSWAGAFGPTQVHADDVQAVRRRF